MGEVTWRATKIYRQDIHVLSVTKRKHYTTQISAEHSSRETNYHNGWTPNSEYIYDKNVLFYSVNKQVHSVII